MKPRDAHSLGPQYVLRYSDARASSRSQGALPPLMTLRGYCVSCLWFHRITYAERQYVDRMFEFVHMQASSPIMSKIPARERMSSRLGTHCNVLSYTEGQYVDRMFEFVHMQASSPIMGIGPHANACRGD